MTSPVASFAFQINDDLTDGDVAWTTPDNLAGSDTGTSTIAFPNDQTTHTIRAHQFRCNVPSNATITGIEVDIFGSTAGANSATISKVRLIKDDTASDPLEVGDDKGGTALTTSPTTHTFGGSSDDWNSGITPSDVHNNAFGVAIQCASTGGMMIVSLATVNVAIYYTVPGSGVQKVTAQSMRVEAASGDQDWVSPENGAWGPVTSWGAADFDSTETAALNADNEDTFIIVGFNMGFDLPSGSVIRGIRCIVRNGVDGVGQVGLTPVWDTIQLVDETATRVGENKSTGFLRMFGPAGAFGPMTRGNNKDLWGGAWTEGQVTHVNFGIALQVRQTENPPATSIPKIAQIEIEVNYEAGEVPPDDTCDPSPVPTMPTTKPTVCKTAFNSE